jgi:hypothetical protein
MSPTLQLSRSSRVADAAWPYEIVLDGHAAGKITNRASSSLEIAASPHTLQLRSLHVINRHLGLASPVVTFDADDGDDAEFVCHPRPFVQTLYWWIACLVGARTQWIVLESASSAGFPLRRG